MAAKQQETVPNFIINAGWYKPSKYGWSFIALLTLHHYLQVIRPWRSIATYGDLGIPHVNQHPFSNHNVGKFIPPLKMVMTGGW